MASKYVTFYSYKGGVGRSMALANIACLLAEDREHPQRVLLWDFDLEAPGLHKLFPPAKDFEQGFVDLAYDFATSGSFGNVAEHIYKSELDGVDVLPAGKVDEQYCAKLASIDWPSFFQDSPEDLGLFFGKLMKWIDEQEYDYVLIDSRTGLNDVAGICTQALPDLLLVIFRLTDQNLDGLSHLVPAIKTQLQARKKVDVEILPVASMLSQSSDKISQQRKSAQNIFSVESFPYIRFDADLIDSEKLFCRSEIKGELWPIPPIVDDYEDLCQTIRKGNLLDTKTSAQSLRRKMARGDYAGAWKDIAYQLKRRPLVAETWHHLRELATTNPDGIKSADQIVETGIGDSAGNVFALEWQASRLVADAKSPEDVNLRESRRCLEASLELVRNDNRSRSRIYREIAEVCSSMGDLARAIEMLEECHRIDDDNSQVAMDLAFQLVRSGQSGFARASKVLDDQPGNGDASNLHVYLWTYLGYQEKAEQAVSLSQNTNPSRKNWQLRQLVSAQRKLMENKPREAVEIANSSLKDENHVANSNDRLNWAEFFVCAEHFGKARELIESCSDRGKDDINGLIALSRFLEGDADVSEKNVLDAWQHSAWSFTELLFFRERVCQMTPLKYEGRLDVLEKLIQKSVLATGREFGSGMFSWRRPHFLPQIRVRLEEGKVFLPDSE